MIKIAIVIICLAAIVWGQDAVLTPSDSFFLQLKEQATYHQSFLVEIDPERIHPQWSVLFAHQAAIGHSVVEL